jgi:broad specificity phosphatase PhoE
MNKFVFIRHGETDMAGRFCGHSDPDLNAAGLEHARQAAERIAEEKIQRIYASDLRRAAHTAEIVGARIGVEVEFRSGLRELGFGAWEGLAWSEIEERFPREAGRWIREFPHRAAPQGEEYADFTARVENAMELLLVEAKSATIAVVAHRGAISHALTAFFGYTEADAWNATAQYGAVIVANPRCEHID